MGYNIVRVLIFINPRLNITKLSIIHAKIEEKN